MKEQRRGPIGRATGIAESVLAGVKRRQAARAPRVLLYDEDGRPRTIDAATPEGAALIATARTMVELAAPAEPDPLDDRAGSGDGEASAASDQASAPSDEASGADERA